MVSTSRPGRGIIAPLFTPARIAAEKLMKKRKAEGNPLTLGEALFIVNPPKVVAVNKPTETSLRTHLINKGLIVAASPAPKAAPAPTTK